MQTKNDFIPARNGPTAWFKTTAQDEFIVSSV